MYPDIIAVHVNTSRIGDSSNTFLASNKSPFWAKPVIIVFHDAPSLIRIRSNKTLASPKFFLFTYPLIKQFHETTAQTSTLTFFILFFSLPPTLSSQPDQATFHPSLSSPHATIPAFPEQSTLAADCPLHLPSVLFQTLPSSCSSPLHRSRCCPSLAAWLYTAYATTALSASAVSYDLPVPPDDSETCVANLEKMMDEKGVKLARPNGTCDLVYCYCGIRLHPLRCPQGDEREMTELERGCRGGGGLGACNNCLHALYQLKENKSGRTNETELERVKKIQHKDCELMGLTWLLAKNRSTYIHTVTSVLRALMMNTDDHDRPRSCSLDSDGLPMAVDSSEISGRSSSTTLHFEISILVVSLSMLYLSSSLFLAFR